MIPDGIYLNLDHQTYLDDPALGASDLKDILANIIQWHASERNKTWQELVRAHMTQKEREKADAESAATAFGTALHCAVLEPKAFSDRYMIRPMMPPEWPKTNLQMETALLRSGHQLPKDKRGASLLAECRFYGIKTADDWEDELKALSAGRILVSARTKMQLEVLQKVLAGHSRAQRFLSNGRAEVSLFYTDATGLRLKCRFDYLRITVTSDVKSYAWRPGTGAVDSFIGAIDKFWYDFAAAHYTDLRVNALPELVAAGKMYDASMLDDRDGDLTIAEMARDFPEELPCFAEDYDFLQKVAAHEDPSWVWISCLTGGYPEVDAVRIPQSILAFQSAMIQVENARQIYRDFRAKFGDDDDQAWSEDRGLVDLNDFCLTNGRARDRGNRKWDQG